ncbi:PrsW family intramembrane metalloprotease [bacterium]|nr:PrsW family intramembrane metalloprotease [bacterium]
MLGDIIIANVIASAFLILLIYLLDTNEKEPPWTLVRIYAITIILTYLYGKLIGMGVKNLHVPVGHWFANFYLAGFCEEFMKLIVVLIFVWPLKSFNDEIDGIVYFLIVSAGFTVLENVGYSFRFVLNPYLMGVKTGEMAHYHQALTNIVLIRWFSGHIFVNVISGAFLGLAKKRKNMWFVLAGFIISVLLHGFWNQMAVWGFLWIYALGFLGVDIWIFIVMTKRSFYFQFMKRLKSRLKELIQEARQLAVDTDLVVLMESVRAHIGAIGRMQGEVMVEQAKAITQILPSNIKNTPIGGENGLVRRFLKVYGILGQDRKATSGCFWLELYLKFMLTGFFLLTIIMRLMLAK